VTAGPVVKPGSPIDLDQGVTAGPADRSLALDVLRGLTIGALIVLVFTPTTEWRGHAPWWGWRPSDFFFPFFLLIAGAGVAHQALRRGVPWLRLARRIVLLVVLGLLVNWWAAQGAVVPLRWTGVLQRIALVSLVGTLLCAVLRFRWPAVLLTAVVALAAWGALMQNASADCAEGLPAPDGCGTLHEVDKAVLGESRVYAAGAAGHDPEGIASSLGGLGSFLAGVAAGGVAHRFSGLRRAGVLGAMGAGWLLSALAFVQLQPVGKRMWTPAFASVHAGAALLLLAALTLILDTGRRSELARRVAWPIQALGRNVLGLWLALFFIDPVFKRVREDGSTLSSDLLDVLTPVGYAALFIGGFLAIAAALHWRRWYFRL
jgi:heparan-alpha-glucosaminide N-acetyltransferase